jgi:hypothetical protein
MTGGKVLKQTAAANMTGGKHMQRKCPCYNITTAMQLISVCTTREKPLQVSVLIDHKYRVLILHFVAPCALHICSSQG